MSVELLMPKAGLTMVEGAIGAWTAPEGAAVKKGDPIMEFENEKNTIEFECPADGILHITAQPGDVVAVGGRIGYLAADRAEYESLLSQAASGPPAEAAPVKEEPPAAPAPAAPASPAPAAAQGGRVRASGLARKIAEKNGVDLAQVSGTGPGGRIVKRDVEQLLAAGRSPLGGADQAPTPIPLTGVRRAIAQNMYKSLQEMAQATASVEVDVTDLLALRARLVAMQDLLGCKVTVNDLLARATVKMLAKHPTANATFDGTTILAYKQVHLSVAVGVESGLLVPVLRNADRMNLVELSRGIRDLADRARSGQLADGEQSGGTFTITNMGVYPIDIGTPIINLPQVAIAGFGRSVLKPVVYNGEICQRSMMNVFVTFDQRVFDGLGVGEMMRDLKDYLENPELILI